MGKVLPKKTVPAKKALAKEPPSKEVARRTPPEESTALAKPMDVSAMLLEDFGAGTEHMTMASYAIPRVVILQALSPACTKGHAGQIDGAEVGMIMENVSQQLWDGEDGITFLPISYRLTYINWWPRNSNKGKGFIADLGPDPKALAGTTKGEHGENMKADGSEIVLTAEYFGFILDEAGEEEPVPVMLSMAKSQMKKSKAMNTLTRVMIKAAGRSGAAPLFYCTYHLTTVMEQNAKGQPYSNWSVERGPALLESAKEFITPEPDILPNGDKIYMAARAFKQRVDKGEVKVAEPVDDSVPSSGHADDSAPM